MPLHESARAPLGGWPVGPPPSGPDGVHGLRVTVRDCVHPVVRCDVHRAARLRVNAQGGSP